MTTTRRDILTAALTTSVGGTVTADLAGAQARDHDHDHQAVPSDPALRVKALESLARSVGRPSESTRLCLCRYMG